MFDCRVSFEEMQCTLEEKLIQRGFSREDAGLSARIFTESTCDGIYSHGLYRFPKYISDIDQGHIKINQKPEKILENGVIEQWDGKLGPGNLNAWFCMDRALDIAREKGMGCVALCNTNHWMRGGTYGWQAANRGCLAMLWSNTIGNMPAWGGKEPVLGNNPFILAVPREKGHVVLDFSQSLYSYGKLSLHRKSGKSLPYDGGYDPEGNLTKDADAILQTQRLIPAGLWKGSGLSLMLDLMAGLLSGGKSAMEIREKGSETALSQVFIAISPSEGLYNESREKWLDRILDYTREGELAEGFDHIRYPGEQVLSLRQKNLTEGIPVEKEVWELVRAF